MFLITMDNEKTCYKAYQELLFECIESKTTVDILKRMDEDELCHLQTVALYKLCMADPDVKQRLSRLMIRRYK